MKRFQLNRLKYDIKTFGFWSGLKFWIKDIEHAHERCSWCGCYLHPQLLFKGVQDRPSRMTYHARDKSFICAQCHYVDELLTKYLRKPIDIHKDVV